MTNKTFISKGVITDCILCMVFIVQVDFVFILSQKNRSASIRETIRRYDLGQHWSEDVVTNDSIKIV
jgi:hypothetical protein